jgi:DNA-damage-inducible protein D
MEKEIILKLTKTFEEFAYEKEGIEFWLARELQELLGYAEWRNFINVIDKAKESCKTTGEAVPDHFVDVNKMVRIGSGAEKQIDDMMLTRYACYLITQNGDPKKGTNCIRAKLLRNSNRAAGRVYSAISVETTTIF